MIGPLIGVGGIFCILVASEYLWRNKSLGGEGSRKFVHILSGSFIAFWPFFMTFGQIQLLSVALLLVVVASKSLRFFMSIRGVGRQTYGEMLFPVGICVAATIARSDWVFAASILHLSLADGFAALVGVRFLKHTRYQVFGQTKTLVGTAVFYSFSLLITAAAMLLDPASYGNLAPFIVFWLPLMATIAENVAAYGSDNLLVPILVASILTSLQTLG